MIYLDNAAGSHPKPPQVAAALAAALEEFGANPGRGNYALTRRTAGMVAETRAKLAALVHAPDPSRMVFTAGATMAANMAINGLLREGDHVVCSSLEHNAVFRPLAVLADAGRIRLHIVQADSAGYLRAEDVAAALRPTTRLIAINHASNVCGSVQPLAEIGAVAAACHVPLLVDAAQSAGLLPLDIQRMHISLLVLAGHKALYGPAGIGALYVDSSVSLRPLLQGGTGSRSELRHQPPDLPERLEAGSLNTAGIAAWSAALDFVRSTGIDALQAHAMRLTDRLAAALQAHPRLRLQLLPGETRPRVPLLSVATPERDPAEVAAALDAHGVCVRAGYHCAPLAHRTLGSFGEGTLRFSPGWFNTEEEIDAAAAALLASI